MPKFNVFASPRGEAPRAPTAVILCIDRRRRSEEQVDDVDVKTLAAQLCTLAEQHRLGDYEGCDSFSSEYRLYFASNDAERFVAIAKQLVATLTWCHKVKIRVSRDPRGDATRPLRP